MYVLSQLSLQVGATCRVLVDSLKGCSGFGIGPLEGRLRVVA